MKLKLQKYHRLLEILDVDKAGNVTYRKNGKTVPVREDPRNHYLCGGVRDMEARKNLNFFVHTLIAVRWLGDPPEGKEQVSHLDESRQNNRVENLAWVSAKENNGMPLRRQRGSAAQSSAAKNKYKKKVAQYTLKGEFIAVYESAHETARANKIKQGGISHVCLGDWTNYKGYRWKYV